MMDSGVVFDFSPSGAARDTTLQSIMSPIKYS
jgi:hypothetical protein